MQKDILKHCDDVKLISIEIANHLNLPEKDVREISIAAHLHDIGKFDCDERILNKPDKLTLTEFENIKLHILYGALHVTRCCNLPFNYTFSDINDNIIKYIYLHHERADGTGYLGIKGNKIPLGARIIQVADVYSALISKRAYKCAFSIEDAIYQMQIVENKRYDKTVLNTLTKIVLPDFKRK